MLWCSVDSVLKFVKLIMSQETQTVSLTVDFEEETAVRLHALAERQGISLEAALTAAVAEYIALWEDHLDEVDDEPRENLPWLNGASDDLSDD